MYYKSIIFVTGDYSEVYKNDYVKNKDQSNYQIIGDLVDGHFEVVEFTAQQKNVGTTSNLATIKIVDENGKDVTDLYSIIRYFGKLEVTPLEIVIKTASASKKFDSQELTAHQFEIVSGYLNVGEVFKEEKFVYSGKQQARGSSDNVIEFESIKIYNGTIDVTDNYSISVIYGKLTITG